MHENDERDESLGAAAESFDSGRAAPTPLFLGFLGALLLAGIAAFHGGVTVGSTVEFLLLAAIITGCVMVAFSIAMIWATRVAQRATNLAAARPGAVVARGMRVRELSRALRLREAEPLHVPLGPTVLADDTGLELWGGSAEHPTRVVRVRWEDVVDIRVHRITRWGRTAGGLVVAVRGAGDESVVELPLAIAGAGLGGLFAPSADALGELVSALQSRHVRSIAAA